MQFTSILATVFAVTVAAIPQSPPSYNSTIPPAYPTNGTSTYPSPTGTGAPAYSTSPIATYIPGNSAGRLSTGALGSLIVVGGMALAL